ncbi:MAG: glycine zipper 2TM domain-containing protein [Proteobacteria bacterium]|nr:glycine zipper 2TM domain-containing protein [Pseudomonadota bacterium]MBU4471770.1 glycine zipper 2TM domain-containing protein [Pseudomonadota bacterium]
MPLWKNIRWFVIAALVAGLCASCASSRSANVYSRNQARQAQTVQMGVVESVKSVLIEGTKTPLGTIAGGALGGVAGSAVGGGKGAQLMTVVGVIAGAAAGTAAEEGITRKQGLEIIVRLDNGTLLSVVQEADVAFQAGDYVKIITGSDGTTRVSR